MRRLIGGGAAFLYQQLISVMTATSTAAERHSAQRGKSVGAYAFILARLLCVVSAVQSRPRHCATVYTEAVFPIVCPKGLENQREAPSYSPVRFGGRARNFQTCFLSSFIFSFEPLYSVRHPRSYGNRPERSRSVRSPKSEILASCLDQS